VTLAPSLLLRARLLSQPCDLSELVGSKLLHLLQQHVCRFISVQFEPHECFLAQANGLLYSMKVAFDQGNSGLGRALERSEVRASEGDIAEPTKRGSGVRASGEGPPSVLLTP
jgi:hypothetical protein